MTTASDWIKTLDSRLVELAKKPRFRTLPFPWHSLESGLGRLFGKSGLKVQGEEKGWLLSEDIKGRLGENSLCFAVRVAPIGAPVYLAMQERDAQRLIVRLLGGEEDFANFIDRDYTAGFSEFLLLEVMKELSKEQFFQGLSLSLQGQVDQFVIASTNCFAVDVKMQFDHETFVGTLFVPEGFREEWERHSEKLSIPLTAEQKEKIIVELVLKLAETTLTLDEFKSVERGDFVVLDHCLYDPELRKGSIALLLQGKPLFRGRIKEGEIKLSEYPLYEEANVMQDETNLYGDLEAAHAEEVVPEKKSEEALLEKLPIQLTVECGRIVMNAKQLTDLAPGNTLPLERAIEQGVDLVVQGKKVGRGELIKMGDLLGVRILEW